MVSWIVAPALGAGAGSEPPNTASRLNGNVDVVLEANGGSMRENGAETRRFLLIPAIFLLGDLPAGAVIGERAVEVFALTGVENREGNAEGGGIDFVEVNVNVNGFSKAPFLLFFVGESNTEGSTFSLSNSSKDEASKARLFEDGTLFTILDLPLSGDVDFCARAPKRCQHVHQHQHISRVWHTILAILSVGQVLQTRIVERCKWHARSVCGHGEMSDERVLLSNLSIALCPGCVFVVGAILTSLAVSLSNFARWTVNTHNKHDKLDVDSFG